MDAEIKVPPLGESVSTATVARWLKQAGEAVAADEPLVELETDKVTVEVNAPAAGTLGPIQAADGAEVEVGAVLGTVESGGAAAPAPKAATTAAAAPAAKAAAAPAVEPAKTVETAKAEQPVEQAAEPPADRASPEAQPGVQAPPPALGPVSRPAAPPAETVHAPLPAAAKMMQERNVDAAYVGSGSGKDGRITKGDVIDFLARPAPAAPAPAAPTPTAARAPRAADAREERVKMTRLRRTIAARLKEAQNTAAMLTTFNEVDMSAAMALRSEYKDAFEKKHGGVRLGFMSFFVRACVSALAEFPAVNAEIDGEEIVYKNYVHMGIAVGGASGLVVPVIRDAHRMGFADIEKAIGDFGRRARDGQLKLEELVGGSFSITNGGIYGSLMSTPILNPPQSAILGMHKIQERPVAIGGKVEIRPMMYLALSYDHRIVDGKEAVSFLVRVKEGVEDPRRLLLGL
jgi:2-oxoglutarate dehydrogenase E2 component (dihydrolipoamide succinyltransferase)